MPCRLVAVGELSRRGYTVNKENTGVWNLYVVLLDEGKKEDAGEGWVYFGESSRSPEERLEQHLRADLMRGLPMLYSLADSKRFDERTEIASMGSDCAIAEAGRVKADASIGWFGSMSTPAEWTKALGAAREVVIESARRGELLTYGELQVAKFRATQMKIGHSMYGRFCMELNQLDSHSCLISSHRSSSIRVTVTLGPASSRTPRA